MFLAEYYVRDNDITFNAENRSLTKKSSPNLSIILIQRYGETQMWNVKTFSVF